MSWWEQDKPAEAVTSGGGEWWAKDKPVERRGAAQDVMKDKVKLAEETSGTEAFKIGAGRMSDRIYEGVKAGGMGVGAIFSELLPTRLKQIAQDAITEKLVAQQKREEQNTAEYKPLEEAHPIATTFGEATPLAASPVMRVVGKAGALPAIANSAISAAVPATLEYGTAEERGKRGAAAGVGGAAGSVLTQGAAKVFKGVSNVLTPEARRLAELAVDKFKIPLDAAQKTGNKFLQTVSAAMEHMPVTSTGEAAKKITQRDAFTREVMKTLGETADEATPATFKAAKERIGGDFERVFSKVHVNLDEGKVQSNLAKVVQEATDTLTPDQAAIVVKRVGQIIDKVDDNGKVAGRAYQAWRSQVQKQAEGTSDRWLGTQLRNVYRAVDEAAYKAAAEVGEDTALKTARGQWKNLRTIEPLVAKSEDGIIPPKLLREAVRKSTSDYAEGGGGDIAELARIGHKFIADQVPNSGTAQRSLAQSLLTGGTMGGVSYAASGDPAMAAKVAAGSVLLPKAIQTLINSGTAQKLMSGGGRQLSPLEQVLMERMARLGAVGVAKEASE
jgi:hypothetical protein